MDNEVKFAEKGSEITIYHPNIFVNSENIYLKNRIIISEFCTIHGGITTVIGNFVHISSFSSIAGGGVCLLEDFVGLSAGVRLITGSEMVNGEGLTNPTIPPEYRAVYRSYIHLEKHVFLATNVIIHPGVTIGEGAVIGANSVVTKDIEPWTISFGTPARAVGKRPSDRMKIMEGELYRKAGIIPFNPEPLLYLKRKTEYKP
jgi:acetyltransferase-like isoleucine patch superfamily enzyme